MARRRIHYVKSRDGQVTYQEAGDGPPVILTGGTLSLSVLWDEPLTGDLLDRMTSFCRVIAFDPRGVGRADPLLPGEPPTTEEHVADLLAVLDHTGVERTFVYGFHAGVAVGIAAAVAHPERFEALVLVNGWARMVEDDDQPWGLTREFSDQLIALHDQYLGTGMFADAFIGSRSGDPDARAMVARLEQTGTGRAQSVLLSTWAQNLDIRPLVSQVRVPTLVMHTAGNRAIAVGHGRYLGAHIPGARYLELAGVDHLVDFENADVVLEELEAVVTGARRHRPGRRAFATLLFTDVVGSTIRAAQLGDRRWRELLDRHDAAVRTQLERHGGREVNTAGDGFLATFDVPGRAITCAQGIRRAVADLGLEVRSGIHAGEVELRGDDVGGLAVHLAARVAALAGAAEILVSRTVVDLVLGSGILFADRGEHELKGVPGMWHLFAVDDAERPSIPSEP